MSGVRAHDDSGDWVRERRRCNTFNADLEEKRRKRHRPLRAELRIASSPSNVAFAPHPMPIGLDSLAARAEQPAERTTKLELWSSSRDDVMTFRRQNDYSDGTCTSLVVQEERRAHDVCVAEGAGTWHGGSAACGTRSWIDSQPPAALWDSGISVQGPGPGCVKISSLRWAFQLCKTAPPLT